MGVSSAPESSVSSRIAPSLAFVASTGRTATLLLATTLNQLPSVRAFHEGHDPESGTPVLPLINVQNRQAWNDPEVARSVVHERRSADTFQTVAEGDSLVVDVAGL